MSHWTRRYAVPFFVCSLTAFVVTATALAVVLVSRRPTSPPPRPVDCVVGMWQAVSYWEVNPAFGAERLELRGAGHVFEFREDGTGSVDFGDGTRLAGELLGFPVDLSLRGRLEFRYTAEGGVMRISDQHSEVSVTFYGLPTDDVVTLEGRPFHYECEGDTLIQSLDGSFHGEFVRLSDPSARTS